MAGCKLSLCFLVLAVLGISAAVQYRPPVVPSNQPVVSIQRTNGMTPSMQLDASDFLKRAYTLNTPSDRCSIFRQLYAEKYTQYKWHVAMHQAYSVDSLKSIELRVNNNENYILFATKK
ncbi:hypothetical protein ILUMI_10293 [Ignelater luminosus]|uniref:Uncharacterized protein n=1 Tax=Ignelater luminosus TaxID=2038154 RepID=A0A8K0D0P6_IGNLU|nr:hypothetical protein ILUMI_10293 [Ignelater luminosus]